MDIVVGVVEAEAADLDVVVGGVMMIDEEVGRNGIEMSSDQEISGGNLGMLDPDLEVRIMGVAREAATETGRETGRGNQRGLDP